MTGIRKIHQLDESVVRRIAAGEVIQNPVNVVKELIENSLDSGATEINVIVDGGGYSLIEVSDNGSGISKEDMKIICHRNATSKISTYHDLTHVETYGFRGEALCSISFCSHLTITSNCTDTEFGISGEYLDGELKSQLTRTACLKGTTIRITDLFYKQPHRGSTEKSVNSYKRKILFLLLKYCVAIPEVGFHFVRDNIQKINSFSNSSYEQAFQTFYTYMKITRIDIKISKTTSAIAFLADPTRKMMKMHGIFVNSRLISNDNIKRSIHKIYNDFTPTNATPFFILLIKIPQENVDVNIHPTKKTVVFTRESFLIGKICEAIEKEMHEKFDPKPKEPKKKEILPQTIDFPPRTEEPIPRKNEYMMTQEEFEQSEFAQNHETIIKDILPEEKIGEDGLIKPPTKNEWVNTRKKLFKELKFKPNSKTKLERNDVQTLESFMQLSQLKSQSHQQLSTNKSRLQQYNYSLSSLNNEIKRYGSPQLSRMFSLQELVGFIHLKFFVTSLNNALYIIDIEATTKEIFYQLIIQNISKFGNLVLNQPINCCDLIKLINETQNTKDDGDYLNQIDFAITENDKMFLSDCFNIAIDEENNLTRLPIIVPGYIPNFARLPKLIYDLNLFFVKKETSKMDQTFNAISNIISEFYSTMESDEANRNIDETQKMLKIVFQEMKRSGFHPPLSLYNDGHIQQITNEKHIQRLFAPLV